MLKNILNLKIIQWLNIILYYPTDVDNHFCPWVTISNSKESKLIHYTVIKNGGINN